MHEIVIQADRPHVEALFAPYAEMIGRDFLGYRNHVYRTVTYAMHFLNQDASYERLVETAMVYHDIGLWSDHALAYLEPSEALAVADNEKHDWGLDPEALTAIIHWHHKVFPYRGRDETVVEACRKADWVDASLGWCRKGLSRQTVAAVEAAFPNHGFHQSLVRLAKDYGGSLWIGGFKVAWGIMKW